MAQVSIRATEDWAVSDWASIVQYTNPTQWTSPDPSKVQEEYRGYGYFDGTYHETSTSGESFTVTFQGKRVALYGATGPDYGSFDVEIDGSKSAYSAWAATRTNATALVNIEGLSAGPWHTFTVINGNSSFLFDRLQVLADVGTSDSDSHVTIAEEDTAKYTGTWINNKNKIFSSGGGIYTNETGASATLEFEGSVIAFLGDTNSDHGPYTVQVDDDKPVTLHSSTGCGLPWTPGALCELAEPNLMFLQSYLGPGMHKIQVTNANASFIHIDRFIVVKPDQYLGNGTTTTTSDASTAQPTISGLGGSSGIVGPSTTTGGANSPTPTPDSALSVAVSWLALPLVLWAACFT